MATTNTTQSPNTQNKPIMPQHGKPIASTPTPANSSTPDLQPSLLTIVTKLPQKLLQAIKKKPLLGIALILLFFVVILLSVVSVQRQQPSQNTSQPTQAPIIPVATIQPQPQRVSEAGASEAFLLLESELIGIQEQINNLDLLESRLALPVIEFDLQLTE